MSSISFHIKKKIPGALGRAGVLSTPHGDIETPAFVAVGTKATVKSLSMDRVAEAGVQVVLANTYHLYLQPGDEIIKNAGGLHKFMNWNGPTMTDSGGFQVFSLGVAYGKQVSKVIAETDPSFLIPERSLDSEIPRLATIGADGVSFRSHLDGSLHYITPEKSIEIQHNIGADIIFAFDECTSPSESRAYQEEALNRTHRWAVRSLDHHMKLCALGKRSNLKGAQGSTLGREHTPALFGIVQGGRDKDLRQRSAKFMSELDFEGFGIGGSFTKEDMSTAVKWVNEILPEAKPRHLLGIGEPEDLFAGVENGVDLFDCVLPTRNGRNGTIFTSKGKIHTGNTSYRTDFSPIENGCTCHTCTHYTKAYISHLFHAKEMLAGTLASIHNLHFITHLVADMRRAIINDTFLDFKKDFLSQYIS